MAAALPAGANWLKLPMRIIAGKFRSRQLKSLKGLALRPTSDRLRETLFNVLSDLVVGSRFVDLFAGTGAVGMEAFSRGAHEVIFVEKHQPAVALIKKNLDSLEIREHFRVLAQDALLALERLAAEPDTPHSRIDLLFLDPPYAEKAQYINVLTFLGRKDLLVPGAVAVAEHLRTLDLPESFGKLECIRVLRQGDAALSFYRYRSPSPPEKLGSE
jgi:16S rRNA (guanine(966)-N(2))-methyltransferase RsmD